MEAPTTKLSPLHGLTTTATSSRSVHQIPFLQSQEVSNQSDVSWDCEKMLGGAIYRFVYVRWYRERERVCVFFAKLVFMYSSNQSKRDETVIIEEMQSDQIS